MNAWLPAVLALAGVVVGACLQASLAFLFGRRAEAIKVALAARVTAYADFTRSVSGIAEAQQAGDAAAQRIASTMLMDAKTRIALYGSPGVVHALAQFWRAGARLSTPAQLAAFTGLVAAMRADSVTVHQGARDDDLAMILLGEGRNDV